MTAEQKLSSWKNENLKLCAWLLRDMLKVICDWKMSQTFWRSPALPLEPERESPKPSRLLFCPIRSISDYSNMVVKFTKESTSQNWLKDAESLDKIASDSDLFAKKVCAKEIFGSHLLLQNKTVRASAPNFLKSSEKMGGNQWDALRASHILARQKPLSSVLVRLFDQVRTFFVENSETDF